MLYWQDIEDITLPHTCYVECAECGLSDDFTFQTSAEAHEHWNTAHPDIDELKSELETYKKALETCIEKLHNEIYYEQPDCISYDKEYFTTDYWLAIAKEDK